MTPDSKPRALLVYYTFSQQTGRVAEVMAEALAAKGCDITKGALEFTDPHWSELLEGPDAIPGGADPHDPGGSAKVEDRRDPHPRGGDAERLRPRADRIPDLVADHEHADPLVPEVPVARSVLDGKPFRGVLGLAALLGRAT